MNCPTAPLGGFIMEPFWRCQVQFKIYSRWIWEWSKIKFATDDIIQLHWDRRFVVLVS